MKDLKTVEKLMRLSNCKSINHFGAETDSGKLMKTTSASGSYVEQSHDILFSNISMNEQMIKFRNIQRRLPG